MTRPIDCYRLVLLLVPFGEREDRLWIPVVG